jgi:hypothetical protein
MYGIKVGTVWAILPNDLEAFSRGRRPPGRPRKVVMSAADEAPVTRMSGDRERAGTDRLRRRRRFSKRRLAPIPTD